MTGPRETPLAGELARLIAADGPMGIDRFMTLCLVHPRHGYYMGRDPLGHAGDFITAPEVSQMFGELIGVWCAAMWHAMEAPSAVDLVELGPGRGTLLADLVRAAAVMPGMKEALRIHLVEVSPALRERQRATLARTGLALAWHDRLEDVPPGPALIVANEFFDALPVRQFVKGKEGFHERVVGLGLEEALAFGVAPETVAEELLPAWAREAAEGAVAEVSPAREAVAEALGRRLASEGGAALLIDYGHSRPGLGDTLQAVRKHRSVDPLAAPGESDLTAHVDFSALAAALARGGAAVHGPITQGRFLLAMGLVERLEVLKARGDQRQRIVLNRAAQRLASGAAMGELFKVIAAAHPALGVPPPFEGPDA
jgi:SAM-dependent MidA family methyltransferase